MWRALVFVELALVVAIAIASRRWDDRALAWPSARGACARFVAPADGVITQPFGDDDHLGVDWGGDRGDPVYATSDGTVLAASEIGGEWGNVIRIAHPCGLESVYAHLETMTVAGGPVRAGQRIGTIGTAGGHYGAHLHFELRDRPLPLGGGYGDPTGYVDPCAYIAPCILVMNSLGSAPAVITH